jgi:hypothetical protein
MANKKDDLLPLSSKDLGGIFDELLNNIDFNKELKIDYLTHNIKAKWRDFQFIAGFDIPSDVGDAIKFLTPKSVYKRLEILANNNIIAVSEFAKNKEIDVLHEFFDKTQKPEIYGCNLDTGFVTNKINKLKCDEINIPNPNPEKEIRENLLILNVGNLKIVSIHFASNGPKSLTEMMHGCKYTGKGGVFTLLEGITPQKVIKEFIFSEFKRFVPRDNTTLKEVNVICGDTNITVEKCKIKVKIDCDPPLFEDITLTRDILGKGIAAGLNDYFNLSNTEWLVLMSSHKIKKNRRGFILRNQQLAKSVGNEESEKDADGTILAIKVLTANKDKIIPNWISELKKNNDVSDEYVIYSHDTSHKINDTIIPSEGEALFFKKEPTEAVSLSGEPT